MLNTLTEIYDACADHLDVVGFEARIINDVQTQKRVLRSVGTPLPTRALCLGLGQFTYDKEQARTSSVQLYAFKAMLKAFGIPKSKAAIHDPAFTDVERSFVYSSGISIPDDHESALRELTCEEPTLVFHPFLPFQILELILRQNWSPDHLTNVLFLGPRLDGWLNDYFLKQALAKELFAKSYIPRLDRCIPLFDVGTLTEYEYSALEGTPESAEMNDALTTAGRLSSFCFQWIPRYRVYATGEEFWKVLKLQDTVWTDAAEEEERIEAVARDSRRIKAKL